MAGVKKTFTEKDYLNFIQKAKEIHKDRYLYYPSGAAMGWVLGCLMIVICFCIQIEEQQGIDAKLNFGCGIITALIVFAWFEFVTVVCMAPLAWFVRLF